MAQLNRTLLEIQRAASDLNRNPQRVIFGGSTRRPSVERSGDERHEPAIADRNGLRAGDRRGLSG
ncbi:MAG: hypothetical protein HPM95_16070 [Alphaproteobacteria bacterium]|nr:hypothetical protein [Alphaproteobacteria bacterium]